MSQYDEMLLPDANLGSREDCGPNGDQFLPPDFCPDVSELSPVHTAYMIDLENTGDRWADVIAKIESNDKVYLFWTVNANRVMIPQLAECAAHGCAVLFRECETGMNALDFQLCSEVGYIAASSSGTRIVIVSNDRAYDVLIAYWRRRSVSVSRVGVSRNSSVKPPVVSDTASRDAQSLSDRRKCCVKKWIEQLRPILLAKHGTEQELDYVISCMKAASSLKRTRRMMKIYQEIIKKFGQSRGLQIYNIVKPSVSKIMSEDSPYPLK